MAPAAADTLANFFADTATGPENYDLIVTGDLSAVGSDLLRELLGRQQIDLGTRHTDCGLMIYDRNKQDVHAGGSGCGCSASVLCSYLLGKMERRELNNVLFVATGALMSPTSSQQGGEHPRHRASGSSGHSVTALPLRKERTPGVFFLFFFCRKNILSPFVF